MQSMQRQFGKLWNKGPGDNAKVSALLNDYEDVDRLLAKIIDNAKSWRDSWTALVTTQLQVVTEYEALYDPIVGASDGRAQTAPTPQLQLERTFRLKTAYAELKAELMEEIALIDGHVMQPASSAREAIAPIRKTIKKRENKRLDYEKAQDKALKLQRKPARTAKEDAALAKAEVEVSHAANEFSIADEHLRETLPPIITAAFSLVNPLLANLVMIQTRLLGLYYTTLHGYCQEFGFPSPPPPMEDVVATWNAALGPVRSQVESISFIARGKASQQHPSLGRDGAPTKPGPTPINGARRTSSGLIPSSHARTLRAPPATSLQPPSAAPATGSARSTSPYKRPDLSNATDFTTATILGGGTVNRSRGASPGAGAAASGPKTPSPFSRATTASSTTTNGLAKKKPPPPPPPPKRAATAKPDEWVVAEYAFAGQGQGDLSFRQGDRIRVIKRTDTDQDWWVGELGGVTGSFPANYCKPL
ncbi:b98e527c-558c-4b66-8223-654f88f351e0 [Thermothielavioides terrestris]|uniref:SH3 domain-containing protein n=2 Tax=Thermothielavioides terrestris TaxID=2587410 RepID=G2R287_THETT|nr:uncharacterized protein THITE_2044608 [Thermothielavioides terrestris NRRL 8126]AEO64955.1 hypothetical protein THITE_2044608 [Thermothielavioides terrestris NRRL 8126]SPQ19791.1 b98e527c-558c-4b66-8223-654f88f351e0 [Thermothielavioides terrestris]